MTVQQPLTRAAVEAALMRVVESPPRVGTYDHARWHRDALLLVCPDGQLKFPHLWPPQIPPGKTDRIMTIRG